MYKILMATDGSEHSEKVTEKTIELAKALKADVTAICVIEGTTSTLLSVAASGSPYLGASKIIEVQEEEAKKILNKTKEVFQKNGLELTTLSPEGNPANVICRTAKEGGFDLIVLGSRGLGKLNELFLGSVSNKVAHTAETSVLIVK